MTNKVVVIYGPTAVGKSAIAVELAKALNGEIISADSMQIYKHLNIGSAKVTHEEMQGIVHYLIDIKEPSDDYCVADFCTDARACIKKILNKGKLPIIVGGTGLYLKSLTENYDFGLVPKNIDFRQSISSNSNEEIYTKIIEINPNIKIDINNRQRLIRALERLTQSKKSGQQENNDYNYLMFAILDDRNNIYDRINARVDNMINAGILEEVKFLKELNLSPDALSLKAIGYKEFFPYFNGEMTLEECKDVLKQKTRNYAKRQITFINQFKNIQKIDFCGVKETALKIKQLIGE